MDDKWKNLIPIGSKIDFDHLSILRRREASISLPMRPILPISLNIHRLRYRALLFFSNVRIFEGETVLEPMNLLDRILAIRSIRFLSEFDSLMIACFMICRKIDMDTPVAGQSLEEIIPMVNHTFTPELVIEEEKYVLNSLGWNIRNPTILDYLSCIEYDEERDQWLREYLSECTLFAENFWYRGEKHRSIEELALIIEGLSLDIEHAAETGVITIVCYDSMAIFSSMSRSPIFQRIKPPPKYEESIKLLMSILHGKVK